MSTFIFESRARKKVLPHARPQLLGASIGVFRGRAIADRVAEAVSPILRSGSAAAAAAGFPEPSLVTVWLPVLMLYTPVSICSKFKHFSLTCVLCERVSRCRIEHSGAVPKRCNSVSDASVKMQFLQCVLCFMTCLFHPVSSFFASMRRPHGPR